MSSHQLAAIITELIHAPRENLPKSLSTCEQREANGLLLLSSVDTTYVSKNIIPQSNPHKEMAHCVNWRPYSFLVYSYTFKHDSYDFSVP